MKHGYQGIEYFLAISIKIKDIAHYSTQRFVWKFLQLKNVLSITLLSIYLSQNQLKVI